MNYSLNELQNSIFPLLKQAGELALVYFKKEKKTWRKADRSPVSEADIAINELVTKGFVKLFPDDEVIGEESLMRRTIEPNKRVWLIDPIDGTKDFIEGTAEWSIMLGLLDGGKPSVGFVYDPVHQRLAYAKKGDGAFIIEGSGKPQKMQVSSCADIAKACLIESHNHPDKMSSKIRTLLTNKDSRKMGSLGLKLLEIARGKADLYINSSGACGAWDICGPQLILEEAGGTVLQFSGAEMSYPLQPPFGIPYGFFAANAKISSQFLETLQSVN